jgi:hypothetical protein
MLWSNLSPSYYKHLSRTFPQPMSIDTHGPAQGRYWEYTAQSKKVFLLWNGDKSNNVQVTYFSWNQGAEHRRDRACMLRLWWPVGQFDRCSAYKISDVAQCSVSDSNGVTRADDGRFVTMNRRTPYYSCVISLGCEGKRIMYAAHHISGILLYRGSTNGVCRALGH